MASQAAPLQQAQSLVSHSPGRQHLVHQLIDCLPRPQDGAAMIHRARKVRALPRDVINKIYYANARRVFKL
jgi:hypothetical protein